MEFVKVLRKGYSEKIGFNQAPVIYFCRFQDVALWIEDDSDFIAEAIPADDAPITDLGNRLKTNQLILGIPHSICTWINRLSVDQILECVRRERFIKYMPDEAKSRNMCHLAVMADGLNLQYVPRLLLDYDIAITAVKRNAFAIEFVPIEFRDLNMCTKATMPPSGHAILLEFVPKEIMTYEFCFKIIRHCGLALRFVPLKYRDEIICNAAIKNHCGLVLRYVPVELRNYDMCKRAVSECPHAIEFVPYDMRDYYICLSAVSGCGFTIIFVPEQFRDDQMYLEAARSEPLIHDFVPLHVMKILIDEDVKEALEQ